MALEKKRVVGANALNKKTKNRVNAVHSETSIHSVKAAARATWAVDLPSLLISYNPTLERFHLSKWKEIFLLHKFCTAPDYQHIRLAGDARSLYESFYRSFPYEMVTKARFTGVIRAIYGLEDAKVKKSRDHIEFCKHLEKMKHVYELSSEQVPVVNWRLLLGSLRMFREPAQVLREQLPWSFSTFSSSGCLELDDSSSIKHSDLVPILTHFLWSPTASKFVCERLLEAEILLPVPPVKSSRLSFRRFKQLLTQEPLAVLFDRCGDHTSYYDEIASPVYTNYVRETRKKQSDARKIKRFRFLYDTKTLRATFFQWTEHTRIQKRTRVIIQQALEQLATKKKQSAFEKLRQITIYCICAVEIQRVCRGIMGRRQADDRYRLVYSAVRVQKAYRARNSLLKYSRHIVKRNAYAISIQRVYRGRIGRIRTRKILLEYYYKEMALLQVQREEFREFVRQEMAKVIQRLFHAIVKRKKQEREDEAAQERAKVIQEMQFAVEHAAEEHEAYKAQVADKFKKIKEEVERKKAREVKDANDKKKVIHLRRTRQWEAFRKEKNDTKDHMKMKVSGEYERIKQEHALRTEERLLKKRRQLDLVIRSEDTSNAELALHTYLMKQVKVHRKALAKKYKDTGVKVPYGQVNECARKEVVLEELEKERIAAEEEWLQIEHDFLREVGDKAEEIMLRENEEERRRRKESAIRIQCAFRRFAAKKLLHQEVRGLYVKEFDVLKFEPYYRNIVTNVCRLRKPFSLGSADLEYANKWLVVQDETGDHFYYNPRTLIQSWEKPPECRFCSVCEAFAALYCPKDDTYLCLECRDEKGDATLGCYPYNGAIPGGE